MDKVNIGLLAYLNHMWFFQLPYVDDAMKNPEVKNKFYSLKSSHINIGRVSGGGGSFNLHDFLYLHCMD